MPRPTRSRRTQRRWMRPTAVLIAMIMFAESCYSWVPAPGPVPAVIAERHPDVLRVHTDSMQQEIYDPVVVGDSLTGHTAVHPFRKGSVAIPVSIPIVRVGAVDTKQFNAPRTLGLVVGGGASVLALVLLAWGLALGGMERSARAR